MDVLLRNFEGFIFNFKILIRENSAKVLNVSGLIIN